MKYQIRPGVVLSEVCGEYLLLATMDAGRNCPIVYQINETAAFFWRLLERNLTMDEIVAEAAKEYDAPAELLRLDVEKFAENLLENGYLLGEEEI